MSYSHLIHSSLDRLAKCFGNNNSTQWLEEDYQMVSWDHNLYNNKDSHSQWWDKLHMECNKVKYKTDNIMDPIKIEDN